MHIDNPGSPPRARGKDLFHRHARPHVGITPACAGKSAPVPAPRVAFRDHPRVRGEKSKRPAQGRPLRGSPPRARGKALPRGRRTVPDGITPACAGKSWRCTWPPPARQDHPRVRGEKACASAPYELIAGSPPRARGKDSNQSTQGGWSRITPACAGKRPRTAGTPAPRGDHPRVRGEKSHTSFAETCRQGSPPRARGKVIRIRRRPHLIRITPACAGKSRTAAHMA